MTPKEIVKIILDSVTNIDIMTMHETKARTFKTYCNVEGEFMDYNWKEKDVIYEPSNDKFVLHIESFISGKWACIFRKELLVSEKFTWGMAAKLAMIDIISYGIDRCVKSTKHLMEVNPHNY